MPAPLQLASFATGKTKLKTAQYKPRHEIEATTHSSSTQQQHLKRPRLYFGLPGFANPRTSWSSPKASSSMLALVLFCSGLPQTNASASLVQATSASLESDSDARSAGRAVSAPLAHLVPSCPPQPPTPPSHTAVVCTNPLSPPLAPNLLGSMPRPTRLLPGQPVSAKYPPLIARYTNSRRWEVLEHKTLKSMYGEMRLLYTPWLLPRIIYLAAA